MFILKSILMKVSTITQEYATIEKALLEAAVYISKKEAYPVSIYIDENEVIMDMKSIHDEVKRLYLIDWNN